MRYGLVLLFFLFFEMHLNAACLKTQPNGFVETTTLSGYLISEQEWELPKMKTQFTAWLLKLDAPLTLCSTTFANQPKTLDCIQVISSKSLQPGKWQHISVTGKVRNLSVESDIVTPVAIEADQLLIDHRNKPDPAELDALKGYRCQSTPWAEQRVGGS